MIEHLCVNIQDTVDIIFDKSKNESDTFFTFEIYNKNIDEPTQKLWFLINNAKIHIYKNAIEILLKNNEKNKKIQKYVSEIELKITEYIKKNINSNSVLKNKSFTINNEHIYLKLNKNKNINIYNEFNEKISFEEINKNSKCTLLLEINQVLYTTTEAWLIWIIKQIKVYNEIDFTKSILNITEIMTPTIKRTQMDYSVPVIDQFNNKSPQSNNKLTIQTNNKQLMSFSVSVDQLLNRKNTLKKINFNDIEDIKNLKINIIEDLKINKIEDLKINKIEDLKINKIEDLKINKIEDLKINKIEDLKTENLDEIIVKKKKSKSKKSIKLNKDNIKNNINLLLENRLNKKESEKNLSNKKN
jgi:hypothetical protein